MTVTYVLLLAVGHCMDDVVKRLIRMRPQGCTDYERGLWRVDYSCPPTAHNVLRAKL